MQISEIINLGTNTKHIGLTRKENNFEILNSEGNVVSVHNIQGQFLRSNKLDTKYLKIAYNSFENNYLGLLSDGCLVGLTVALVKKDNFLINCNCKFGNIKDIYYDEVTFKYWLTDGNDIYTLDLNGNLQQQPFEFLKEGIITAIASDGKYRYISYVKKQAVFLAKLSKCGVIIAKIFVGEDIDVYGISINNGVFLGINRNDGNYLYKITENDIAGKESDVLSLLILHLDNAAKIGSQIANSISVENSKLKRIMDISLNVDEILQANVSAMQTIERLTEFEKLEKENLEKVISAILELKRLESK